MNRLILPGVFLYVPGHECLYAEEAGDAGALVFFRADRYDTARRQQCDCRQLS